MMEQVIYTSQDADVTQFTHVNSAKLSAIVDAQVRGIQPEARPHNS
jgi:hypothetical protein